MASVILKKRGRSASVAGTSPETTQTRLRSARERSSSSCSDSVMLEEADKQAVTSFPTLDNGTTRIPAAQGTAAESTQFQHSPLDLSQNTIRVVEVLPLGIDGVVRCSVRHTTIESEYTCLSYVWGDAENSHMIQMNGQPFRVRQNLWNFLKMASSDEAKAGNLGWHDSAFSFEAATRALWIDALCIDQGNNNERNHQVQQMGSIFREAQRVLAWTGLDYEYASLLRYLRVDMETTRFFDADYFLALDKFCQDKYWKRAWITQEVLLARQVLLVANDEAVDLAYLRNEVKESILRTFGSIIHNDLWKRITYTNEQYSEFTILENMHHFNWKECSDRLDVVYSLAALSRDGPELQVEYNIEPFELARKVFRLLKQDLCLAHIRTVFRILSATVSLDWISPSNLDQPLVALKAQLWHADSKRCSSCDFELDWNRLDKNCSPDTVFFHCLRCIRTESKTLNRYGEHLYHGKTAHLLIFHNQPDVSAPHTIDPIHWRLCYLGSDNTVWKVPAGPHSLTEGQTRASLTVVLSMIGLLEFIKVGEAKYVSHAWQQSHSTSTDGSLGDTFQPWRLVE